MIETNIQELENYLNDMSKRTTNMKPVMNSIGETLHRKSMEAFEKEQDPITGRAWSPVKDNTKYSQIGGKTNSFTKNKKRLRKKAQAKFDNKKILRDKGDLQNSIDYTATNDSLEFVAAKEYAATHFFGDEKRKIEQRRYMPFTDDLDIDRKTTDEILDEIGNYIVGD